VVARTREAATTAGRSGTCPATALGNASRRHGQNAARSATSEALVFFKFKGLNTSSADVSLTCLNNQFPGAGSLSQSTK